MLLIASRTCVPAKISKSSSLWSSSHRAKRAILSIGFSKRLLLSTCHGGWKMKHQNSGLRKLVAAVALATLGSVLAITTSFAQSSENCRAYAEDYSLRYSSPWATSNFNIGGRRAGATALAANRSRAVQQSTLSNNAYARCMRGLWP
jgi:hypothetical protein